jgi:sugar phosphate isomerase/epimerase
MHALMQREREVLIELAPEITDWGGEFAIETWMPYHEYSYAVWPEQLSQQVESIDHPSIGVCLDTGHLFLAAYWYGFDFLSAVERLAPLVNHLHLQDLFAVYDSSGSGPLGRGDLHLPLGWGEIPFDQLFGSLAFPREPVFMVEISPKFMAYVGDMMAECQRLVGLRSTEDGGAPED